MKILSHLLALLIGAALATVILYGKNASQRAQIRTRLETTAAADAAKIADLQQQVNVLAAESDALRKNAATVAAQPATSEPVAAAAEPAPAAKPETKSSMAGFLDGLLKDPEMKKAMQSQQTMAMRQFYADYVKAVGLTPAEADKLFALIGERQMQSMEKASAMMKEGADPAASAQNLREGEKAFGEQVKALLGDERSTQFRDYEKTLGDRIALNQLNQSLATSGATLTPDQTKGMLEIIRDERTRAPATALQPGSTEAMTMSDTAIDQFLKQQLELNGRVRTRASSLLTAAQLQALESSQTQQVEMQRMGMKMARGMFSGKSAPEKK